MLTLSKLQQSFHKPHPNVLSPKRARGHTGSKTIKPAFQNGHKWIRKTSLKGAAAHCQQTSRSCVKLCISVSRIPFQGFSHFTWILVHHIDTNLLKGRAFCWFPVIYTRNNHTKSILIKSLLGPLTLASHWSLLVINSTHFSWPIYHHEVVTYQQSTSMSISSGFMASLWLCLISPSIQPSFPHLIIFTRVLAQIFLILTIKCNT